MDLEALLEEVRRELALLRAQQKQALPSVLTLRQAAKELSVGLTTIRLMIRGGAISTVVIGKRAGIPASEIRRLATPIAKPVGRRALRPRQAAAKSAREDAQAGREALRKRL